MQQSRKAAKVPQLDIDILLHLFLLQLTFVLHVIGMTRVCNHPKQRDEDKPSACNAFEAGTKSLRIVQITEVYRRYSNIM